MAKIKEVYRNGSIIHYHFFCPGCNEVHAFNSTWSFNGDFNIPTISPSLKVTGYHDVGGNVVPFVCHSFIKDGMIQFCNDCSHDMKGKTVVLPSIEDTEGYKHEEG